VAARVRIVVHPMGGWLAALTVVERAVAAVEPDADTPFESGIPP